MTRRAAAAAVALVAAAGPAAGCPECGGGPPAWGPDGWRYLAGVALPFGLVAGVAAWLLRGAPHDRAG